jgi:hypothetical protein
VTRVWVVLWCRVFRRSLHRLRSLKTPRSPPLRSHNRWSTVLNLHRAKQFLAERQHDLVAYCEVSCQKLLQHHLVGSKLDTAVSVLQSLHCKIPLVFVI